MIGTFNNVNERSNYMMRYQMQGDMEYERRAKKAAFLLHYNRGKLIRDKWTQIPSDLKLCMMTLYDCKTIGMCGNEDFMVTYDDLEKVLSLFVRDEDGIHLVWSNDGGDDTASILIYLLTEDVECLLYCSHKEHFCYHFQPARDPRGRVTMKTISRHMVSNYRVLDQLLSEKYPDFCKCYPEPWRDEYGNC